MQVRIFYVLCAVITALVDISNSKPIQLNECAVPDHASHKVILLRGGTTRNAGHKRFMAEGSQIQVNCVEQSSREKVYEIVNTVNYRKQLVMKCVKGKWLSKLYKNSDRLYERTYEQEGLRCFRKYFRKI